MSVTKFGFINKSGQFVIDPIFDCVRNFKDGLAAIEIDGKWGYIDINGYVVIEPKYDDVTWCFSEGLACVQEGEKFFFIDKNGRKVLGPLPTADTCSFSEGLAAVGGMGINGYIDRAGKLVIDALYSKTFPFRKGIAFVKKERTKEWGYIDKMGNFTPLYIDNINDQSVFQNDGYIQVIRNRKVGYMDFSGKIIIEPKFDRASLFKAETACVVYNGGKYFIDEKGNFILGPFASIGGPFSDGIAPVQKEAGGKYGYIDKTGRYVLEPSFDFAGEFYGQYAYAKIGNEYYVINRAGKLLFRPEYMKEDYIDFREGMATVFDFNNGKRKCGFIDSSLRVAIPLIFHEIDGFYEGLARVSIENATDTREAFKKLPRYSNSQGVQSPISTKLEHSHSTNTRKTTTTTTKSESGCYIATAVYGTYDCPEVWTLRRYRDKVLDNSWYGRLFIRTYYAVSPTLVKWFGATEWFRNLFYKPLNKWVAKLNKQGFEATPYKDKY